ncbi:hypothetical protein BKA65DRAFT_472009 [Rhexocercosporidium sp. MPI-PUGE-AT-0058]|nr:hypothetical protein BKA65DRAFT_472009 [Rhexocercosporidium sp. MPI-PUGE-AT-0058]
MSDTEAAAPAAKSDTVPQQDVEFIMTCIRNATGGVLTVDGVKIATQLGFQNPRSVTNKISLIKKKYGLAISTAGAKAAASTAGGGDGALAPMIVKTPAPPRTPKGKVTKAKATPKGSAKKTPVKKAIKSPTKPVEADGESEDAEADEEMEDAKETLVEDA